MLNSCSKDSGKIKEYYKDNSLKKEYYVNKAGKINGILKEYNENGQLTMLCYYENGQKQGPKIKYNANGEIMSIGTYKKGLREGKKIFFQTNHQIEKILTYKDDELEGINYTFYSNGFIEGIGYLKDSVINGPQYLYYKNGFLKKYSFIKNNKQIFYKKYDSCGKMIGMEGYIMPEIKGYNSKEIPDTLWIKVLNPPCSENGIKILEYDQTSKNLTYSNSNITKTEYIIQDTSKNIRIEAFVKDLNTQKKLINHFELKK
jgi:antitoxin component YwqK of YwqJK toxin-antitoxin module